MGRQGKALCIQDKRLDESITCWSSAFAQMVGSLHLKVKQIYLNFFKKKQAKATVCAAASFDAKADVGALKKSMKWLGTNEKAIISVLCTKPDNQRQAIAQSYKETKGKVTSGFD